MKTQYIEKARLFLNSRLKGHNTINWNDYLRSLSRNDISCVHSNFHFKRKAIQNTVEFCKGLSKQKVTRITDSPIKAINQYRVIVFEFKELIENNNINGYCNFALSFDYYLRVMDSYQNYFDRNIRPLDL